MKRIWALILALLLPVAAAAVSEDTFCINIPEAAEKQAEDGYAEQWLTTDLPYICLGAQLDEKSDVSILIMDAKEEKHFFELTKKRQSGSFLTDEIYLPAGNYLVIVNIGKTEYRFPLWRI